MAWKAWDCSAELIELNRVYHFLGEENTNKCNYDFHLCTNPLGNLLLCGEVKAVQIMLRILAAFCISLKSH